jgi:4-carboxymuconolactone decarboxylase
MVLAFRDGARTGPSDADRETVSNERSIARTSPSTSAGLENGVTRAELIELVTHPALNAGWPAANTAVSIARKVFGEVDGQ